MPSTWLSWILVTEVMQRFSKWIDGVFFAKTDLAKKHVVWFWPRDCKKSSCPSSLLCSIPCWVLHHLQFLLFLENFFFWREIPKRFYFSIAFSFATEHYWLNTLFFLLYSANTMGRVYCLVSNFTFLQTVCIIMGKCELYHLKIWVLTLALAHVWCSVFLIYKYGW